MKRGDLDRDRCHRFNRRIPIHIWISTCSTAIALISPVAADDIEQGKLEYLRNCASCHGDDGRGAGPAGVKLTIKPADLTMLTRRTGGIFSPVAIRETIDGRRAVRAHQNSDMPIWGCRHPTPAARTSRANRPTELESLLDLACDPETLIRGRIESIVHYLQTIQVK